MQKNNFSVKISDEILRRRTFGIVSHPDAGKTTLTEKLLLFGGAIQEAGAVKSNKIKKSATSDFMEIEKQRGISVATSVMARQSVQTVNMCSKYIEVISRESEFLIPITFTVFMRSFCRACIHV